MKNAPQNDAAYYYLGMAYLGTGDYDAAKKQFQLSLNLDHDNQDIYRGLGLVALKEREYKAAIGYFDKALELSGFFVGKNEYDILWYRADAEKALKDYEASAYSYSALIELEGDTAITRYHRGDSYCKQGMKDEAIADFEAAVAKKGNGYALFWNIYDSLSDAGWEEEASHYLLLTTEEGYIDSKAVSAAESSKYVGMIDYIRGEYSSALKNLGDESLRGDKEALRYLALSYEATGNAADALSIYDALMESTPSTEDFNCKARFLVRQGRYNEAVNCLKEGMALFMAAESEVLYYNLVSAFESAGDFISAKEALDAYCDMFGKTVASESEAQWLKDRNRVENQEKK